MNGKKLFIGWLEKELKWDKKAIKDAKDENTAAFLRGHFEGLRLARGYAKTFLEDMEQKELV